MSQKHTEDGGCGYRYGLSPREGQRCRREVLRDGRCVAHLEDRTPEENEQFETFVAERFEAEDEDCCDFEGFVFHGGFRFRGEDKPRGFHDFAFPPGRSVLFQYTTFRDDAGFCEGEIGGDADFSGAEIGGDANFGGAKIVGDAKFDLAKIGGDARFTSAFVGRHLAAR